MHALKTRKHLRGGGTKEQQRSAAALDQAPRQVWVEALERRVMMDATAAALGLDLGFGSGGYAVPLPASGQALHPYAHLTAAPNGKFYAIVNGYGAWGGQGYGALDLIRVNADGSRDTTFAAAHVVRTNMALSIFGPITLNDSLLAGTVLVQPAEK